MSLAFVEALKSGWDRDLLTDREVRMLFPEATPAARHNQVTRAVKAGALIRLRRGVYCLNSALQRRGVHVFAIANHLYEPSYVSLESALAHHGLIPEAVYGITSVTPRNHARFENTFGIFSYERLATRVFAEGFERHEEDGHFFLIATPVKALLDWVFVHQKHFTKLHDLEEDLRLDLDTFAQKARLLKNQEILAYRDLYRRETVSKVVDLILWEVL